jgi:chemotaxis response regulator CheB
MQLKEFYVVGLGASAGGHQSLKEFFLNLPEQPGAAFVVVTHLLRNHFSILDQMISKFTGMRVVRIAGGEQILPNHVYVMPEKVKVEIRSNRFILRSRLSEEVVNKTIDTFFHSLGKEMGRRAVGIVFSGMGSDGYEGVQTIHKHGGIVLVQDPHSAEFKGMPETIINRNSPDAVLPPSELASGLMSLILESKSALE